MNLDPLSLSLSQISYLVANLSKKTYKSSVTEISELVESHGPEADRHLLRCLFSSVDFASDGKGGGKDHYQVQLLTLECSTLITKPNFITTICFAIDNPLSHQKSLQPTSSLISNLSRILKLNKVQEVTFAIALQHSAVPQVKTAASEFLKTAFPELIRLHLESVKVSGRGSTTQDIGLQDTAVEVLHLLLSYLRQDQQDIVTEDKKKAFLATLKTNFTRDRCPVVLLPLLYSSKSDLHMDRMLSETGGGLNKHGARCAMHEVFREHGYSSCATVDECKKILQQYNFQQPNAQQVGQVLGMMATTMSEPLDTVPSLKSISGNPWSDSKEKTENSNTWNVEVFMQTVKEMSPSLSAHDIMEALDHPGFVLSDKSGLQLIIQGIKSAMTPHDTFPVDVLYKSWSNTHGQFSFLQQALMNSALFCFAEYQCHRTQVEILKQQLDDENRDISNWKSLDLVERLLRLADQGHEDPVRTLFMWPVKHCPDLLILSLLQLSPPILGLRQELISTLLPTFFGIHPNSAIILHYAWHGQGQSPALRQLVMQCMAEWYLRGEPAYDQAKLSRILDVAQDLKALSQLLSAQPFQFVIDLATLASRREYLKLDKWLTDKIRKHGETFVQACVTFLQRRCPSLLGASNINMKTGEKIQLPPDTLSVMLVCLRSCLGNVSQDMSETILTILGNCGSSLNKSLQPPPGVMSSSRIGPQAPTSQASGLLDNILKKPMDPISGMSTFLGGQSQKPGQSLTGPQQSQAPQNTLPGFGASLGHTSAFAATGSNSNDVIGSSGLKNLTPGMLSPGSGSNQSSSILPDGPLHPIGRSDSGIDSVGPPSSSFSSTIGQGLGSSGGGLGLSGQSMGFGNQFSNQGFSSNNLISSLSNLNINSDPFSNSFGEQKTGDIGRKMNMNDIFGQMKGIGSTSNNPTSSLGGGLGMGIGGSLDMFGSKKPSQTGGLSAATQQAFQQAAAKVPKQSSVTDLSQAWPEMSQQFSKEVEDEANSYFQRIYNQPPHQTLTVDEILELLKKFKDSSSKNEREVFNCMMRNLFEEYRFFPQYPDKELYTTACLFGGIIEKNLVTYLALGIALRYVLEALRKPPTSKMHLFGIAALDRFKGKLREYPQYCQHINAIPHIRDFPAALLEYVEYGQRSMDPPNKSHSGGLPQLSQDFQSMSLNLTSGSLTPTRSLGLQGLTQPPRSSSAGTSTSSAIGKDVIPSPSIVKSTNIDTLLEAHNPESKAITPPENTQDKIAFIFNNLSVSNMTSKGEEMCKTTKEEYTPWLSQYFVMKRVSIEPNFHQLYSNFLDCLKMPQLNTLVQEELKRNIKVLLQSDKIDENISDRSLLKNLGHFLGLITVAKNKPILFEDFDLRSLLYEAYHKGSRELLYVVPFVAKILESVNKSKIFRLPNPWTQALIEILVELHMEKDLKLNLKFEVEVLCKNLQIDINKHKPTYYLRDPTYKAKLTCQLALLKKDGGASKPGTPVVSELPQTSKIGAPPGLSSIVQPGGMNTPPAGSQVPVPPTMTTGQRVLPRFSFHDINIYSLSTLQAHLTVKMDIPLLVTNPALKNCIRPSVERAVQDLLQPVVDRAIKIAMTTSEQIAKKDFALDPEEFRMKAAAHHMVRNLTAGMALITCREPLLQGLTNHLKNNFMQAVTRIPMSQSTQPTKEMIEQAATVIAADNVELACCYIQKTAIEKAVMEMDKRMSTEFDLRKHARQEGRRYCDPVVLTYQAERMPEQIRLKVGGVTPQQTAVYEEFARNVPGFLPSNDSSQPSGFLAKPMPTWGGAVDEITDVYNRCIRELDLLIQSLNFPSTSTHLQHLQGLKEATTFARNNREVVHALALLQKAVEGLLDPLSMELRAHDTNAVSRYRECHILVLKALQDQHAYGPQWTNKHVIRCLFEHRDEYKFNLEAVDCLIRSHFINLQQYDAHLSQAMESGLNYNAVLFAIRLVRLYLVEEKHGSPVTESDLYNTVETLVKLNTHSRGNAPEGLSQLIEVIRASADSILDKSATGPTYMMHSGISQAREYDDPPGLSEKTEYLLREWVNIYHSPASGRDSTRGFSTFVQQMHQQGILRTDDLITRFFRSSTELCVDLTYRLLQESTISPALLNPTLVRAKCFHTLDAFVRLITLLVKHSGDASNSVTKINLLNKVLGIVVGVLLNDHEQRNDQFHQMPYHRIFIMLFYELNAPEHVLESINFQTLTAFTNTYHILRPSKAPGFSFAWLELIAYRGFISRMLLHTPQQKGWPMYAQLLIDLFKFLAPFLRIVDMEKSTQVLYRGTLRLLLVLLHDFPEFLCDYHYGFCDVIPANCIQLRNLILSAFPRNMRLPDPFTPNLKVDMLQEINIAPRILTNFAAVMPAQFKKDLDSYLKTRAPVTFLSDLRSNLQISNDPGVKYSIALINSLVLYVGTQAIQHLHTKGSTPSMSTITHSSHMDIFQNLSVDLDTEGRYLFLNAIANQLRYPNSHTHYFSCTLLYLFAEANQEAIQEQITRVLLERLIVNRPHPWGLLITFIELIKNPSFNFWKHEFVHCAPDISKLFESVARSCMGKQFNQQQQQPATSQSQSGNGGQNQTKNQSNSPQGGTSQSGGSSEQSTTVMSS